MTNRTELERLQPMTTEKKALALLNEVRAEYRCGVIDLANAKNSYGLCFDTLYRAIEREQAAIEAREADKKAFSDAVKKAIEDGVNEVACDVLSPFIQPEPEPDPLVEIWKRLWPKSAAPESSIAALRNALAARGYKIERIEQ